MQNEPSENDDRARAARIALGMYLGESCKYCGHTFTHLEELAYVVFVGYHEHGRIAHKVCWDAHNPDNISE